jgi:hypothetical protein
VPKTSDGTYRATASLAVPGKNVGPYRYHGLRRDDPNDIVLHEHRRDLRGFAVVSAWIDHDDSRAINTYDSLVNEDGRSFVKHYVLDLGSTLGSGTEVANSPRSGGEYLFGWKQSTVQFLSLGAIVPYWAHARYPDLPSVGRFESAVFDPEKWVPEYPNPAFLNRLPDDEFWAAKQIMAVTNEDIRAVVESAGYSDPRASDWVTKCLIERRNKIGQAYFAKLLPIDKFEVQEGQLRFIDLGERHGMGSGGPYNMQWFELNNENGKLRPVADSDGSRLPSLNCSYLVARITSKSRSKQSVDVTLRRDGLSTAVVGIARTW